MWFTSGARLHDRFTLVERIGAGGMSEVWRATDEVLGRPVAVKVLAARLATDPRLQDATWREARAAARLSHPYVTQVHDYGEVRLASGQRAGFLVMELVAGDTLADRLASGPLPWRAACQVGRQVAAALAAAHRLGVVHRDIKPGNVMLTAESGPGGVGGTMVKVLDFGIAAMAGADTDPGRLMGTPQYTAPERRAAPGPAQPAGDVYALGVLLYEALVGRPPGDSAPQPSVPQLPVPGLPDEVARICVACLSPDPARRPGAAQVAASLAEAAGEPDHPPAPTVPLAAAALPPLTRVDGIDRAPRRAGRWALLAGGGVVLVGLGVALLVAALRGGEQTPAAPPAAGPGTATASSTPPAGEPSPTAVPGADVADIIRTLDGEIRSGFNEGAITRDAYDDLRDELADLREAQAEDDPDKRDKELRKAALDMREEVEDLLADGEIRDPATADRLIDLLDALLAAG